MRTTILVFLVVLLALVLAACDERGQEKPSMTFTTDRDTLTNKVPGLNYCNLTVILDGEPGNTHYERINFTYDKDLATLVGDGSDERAYTDSMGIATAEFIIEDDTYGSMTIDAAMDKYSSVHQTMELTLIDAPVVGAIAEPDTLPPDGTSQFTITVQLTSNSDNIANKQVNFLSELELEHETMFTDENGQCVNHVTVNDEPDTYTTTVTLEDFGTNATVYHHVVNP